MHVERLDWLAKYAAVRDARWRALPGDELVDEIVRDELRQVACSIPKMSWTGDLALGLRYTWT